MENPKLIAVDAFPVEEDGHKMYCIRDPQNSDTNPLIVSELALYIITFFDGRNSIESIIASLKEKFGKAIQRTEFESLVRMLDNALLLDNKKYVEHQRSIENNFYNSETREAYLSGLSYPEDEEKLEDLLNGFFLKAETKLPGMSSTGVLRGLVSPHIDFIRGGTSYAVAYRELLEQTDADTYLIFGTSHYAQTDNPFILTRKPFSTPFGQVETDLHFLNQLENKCRWDLYEGEIFHRTEHSIEFQVVFLQHILKGKKNFKIIPVLCNSFHQFVNSGSSPAEDERILTFLTEIKKLIASYGNSILVIAGVDLSHVGPKFGDKDPIDEKTLSWIRKRDAISLGYTEKIDAEGFYRSVEKEKDKRKICGLSSIYSLLKVTDASYGTILDYDNAFEEDTGSVVTFASAGYYKHWN